MSEYKGKLHETVTKFPQTDIWNDSCALSDLEYAIERGAVGATTNPLIVGLVIKRELATWEKRIKEVILEHKDFDEEQVAWFIIEEMAEERAKLLLPTFEKFNAKKGRLSIQTNAKAYRNADKMIEQACHLASLGENMQIKMPTCEAGIKAFEEVTYRGVSINATVSFTVAQAVAVAEAVERGLKRREAEGLPIDRMSPVCTIMIGRTDDWLKEAVKRDNVIVDPEILEWAGVAVIKEADRIYKERGYRLKLLAAAYRNHYHWSELIGGDIAMTITQDWQERFNESDIEVVERMSKPVCKEYLEKLKALPEFIKAFDENGMKISEFHEYGAFKRTLSGFLAGYDDLIRLVRGYMITDPMKD